MFAQFFRLKKNQQKQLYLFTDLFAYFHLFVFFAVYTAGAELTTVIVSKL